MAEKLVQQAPRPVMVNTQADGGSSALSTLVLAQLLPDVIKESRENNGHQLQLPAWGGGKQE